MSGKQKLILILAVLAVAYCALLTYGLRSRSSAGSDFPEDEDRIDEWVERNVPSWMTSFDQILPKPRLRHPDFPITLVDGGSRVVELSQDEDSEYREAVLRHVQGPVVTVRYTPAQRDELPRDKPFLEFELRPSGDEREKSFVVGKSGGKLRLESEAQSAARVDLVK